MAKKKSSALVAREAVEAELLDKHPNAGHPATGLLEHEYEDQAGNAGDPRDQAGVCRICGFDEEWHELEAADYTGDKPRPKDWREKLEKLDPKQAELEAGE